MTSKATKYLPIHLLDEALRTEIYPINSKVCGKCRYSSSAINSSS